MRRGDARNMVISVEWQLPERRCEGRLRLSEILVLARLCYRLDRVIRGYFIFMFFMLFGFLTQCSTDLEECRL